MRSHVEVIPQKSKLDRGERKIATDENRDRNSVSSQRLLPKFSKRTSRAERIRNPRCPHTLLGFVWFLTNTTTLVTSRARFDFPPGLVDTDDPRLVPAYRRAIRTVLKGPCARSRQCAAFPIRERDRQRERESVCSLTPPKVKVDIFVLTFSLESFLCIRKKI